MTKTLVGKIVTHFLVHSCYQGEGMINENRIGDVDNHLPLDEVNKANT